MDLENSIIAAIYNQVLAENKTLKSKEKAYERAKEYEDFQCMVKKVGGDKGLSIADSTFAEFKGSIMHGTLSKVTNSSATLLYFEGANPVFMVPISYGKRISLEENLLKHVTESINAVTSKWKTKKNQHK